MEIEFDKIPFFSTLSKEEQKTIRPLLKIEKISKNKIIFQKNDSGNKMYFIINGEIKIYDVKMGLTKRIVQSFKVNKNEDEVNILKTGDFFGEMALVSNEPRMFFAKAHTDVLLYSIDRNDLKSLIDTNSDAERIIAETLVNRILENN